MSDVNKTSVGGLTSLRARSPNTDVKSTENSYEELDLESNSRSLPKPYIDFVKQINNGEVSYKDVRKFLDKTKDKKTRKLSLEALAFLGVNLDVDSEILKGSIGYLSNLSSSNVTNILRNGEKVVTKDNIENGLTKKLIPKNEEGNFSYSKILDFLKNSSTGTGSNAKVSQEVILYILSNVLGFEGISLDDPLVIFLQDMPPKDIADFLSNDNGKEISQKTVIRSIYETSSDKDAIEEEKSIINSSIISNIKGKNFKEIEDSFVDADGVFKRVNFLNLISESNDVIPNEFINTINKDAFVTKLYLRSQEEKKEKDASKLHQELKDSVKDKPLKGQVKAIADHLGNRYYDAPLHHTGKGRKKVKSGKKLINEVMSNLLIMKSVDNAELIALALTKDIVKNALTKHFQSKHTHIIKKQHRIHTARDDMLRHTLNALQTTFGYEKGGKIYIAAITANKGAENLFEYDHDNERPTHIAAREGNYSKLVDIVTNSAGFENMAEDKDKEGHIIKNHWARLNDGGILYHVSAEDDDLTDNEEDS